MHAIPKWEQLCMAPASRALIGMRLEWPCHRRAQREEIGTMKGMSDTASEHIPLKWVTVSATC